LRTSEKLQDQGQKLELTGGVMAAMGAPVAGVGATPGAAVASFGGIEQGVGKFMEIGVNLITGDYKKAATGTGETVVTYGLGELAKGTLNEIVPGSTGAATQLKKVGKIATDMLNDGTVDYTSKKLIKH